MTFASDDFCKRRVMFICLILTMEFEFVDVDKIKTIDENLGLPQTDPLKTTTSNIPEPSFVIETASTSIG